MLFNSYSFIFAFLPILFVGYFWLIRQRLILGSKIWLVVGSLFFYGYWNIVYIPLLIMSILVNFSVGSRLAGNGSKRISRKKILTLGIIFNLGLLAYFKYTDFFLENFNGIFASDIPLPHIVLPLGISFFTFTQIAFLVDAYKDEVKEYDLLRYMLFVTYFPHLLAGPILHHKEMMPQFSNRWNCAVRWRNIAIGLFLFSIGLFKKVVIADTLGVWANSGFDTVNTLSFFEAWATSLSYTLQLYYDFSGYTDMALGVSLLFNIRLPLNFNSPYKARDIQDFWRRWHMTLSRFLRDYIYIPLGGNKGSSYRVYFHLFIVFFIGGLWHGASWMFVIWGVLHGIAIVIHRVWKNLGLRMWSWLGWSITFNFINITWVFFRAENLEMAEKILGGMVGLNGVMLPEKLASKLGFLEVQGIQFGHWLAATNMDGIKDLFIMIGILVLTFTMKNTQQWVKHLNPTFKFQWITVLALAFGILSLSKVSEFLYFQF